MSAFTAEQLDLVEPAYLELDDSGGGEIVFGALQASLECSSAADGADFDWLGLDDGDEVNGTGSITLMTDGTIKGEFVYDNGDETTLKARPW